MELGSSVKSTAHDSCGVTLRRGSEIQSKTRPWSSPLCSPRPSTTWLQETRQSKSGVQAHQKVLTVGPVKRVKPDKLPYSHPYATRLRSAVLQKRSELGQRQPSPSAEGSK